MMVLPACDFNIAMSLIVHMHTWMFKRECRKSATRLTVNEQREKMTSCAENGKERFMQWHKSRQRLYYNIFL